MFSKSFVSKVLSGLEGIISTSLRTDSIDELAIPVLEASLIEGVAVKLGSTFELMKAIA